MPTTENVGKLILRVTIAGFILVYGLQKISHPDEVAYIATLLTDAGLPGIIAYGVYVGEIIAPLLMMVGWRTKLAASVVVCNMLVVLIIGHSGDIFPFSTFRWWAIELQTLFLLGALSVALLGAGRYALSSSHRFD